MLKRLQLERIHTVLLDSVIAKADVQTIFDRLYEVTNLPAICFDPTFSLIAYSFRRPFYFVHWEMIAANGRSPDGIIKEYDYLTDQEKMVRCGSASIFNDRASAGYPQACGPVFVNGQLCCYCGIMVEDAEQSDVIAASDMLAQAIAATMRREMRIQSDLSFLAGKEINPRVCAAIEKDGGAYLFSVLTCLKHSTSVLQFIRQSIESRNSHCITHIHNDGCLYMLFSCLGRREELEAVTALLSRLCAEHMLFAGVSDYFYDIKSLPLHRQQAEVTLSIARALEQEPKAYHFLEMYCSVIWQAAIERLGCDVCTYPAITMLDRQDAAYNTDYLKTLDVWLGNFNRKSVAATILGTHKTTVTNRLMKISELSGVDVFEHPYEFQTGIEMYRFMRQIGGREKQK